MSDSQKTQKMPLRGYPKEDTIHPKSFQQGAVFQGYEVGERLSADSGEAEIYIAFKNKNKFIIKHYYPNFKPKLEILERLQGINHPDIIHLYEYGTQEGRFFEIMDFAEGGSLADKDSSGKYKYLPMTEATVYQVIKEIISAFDYCHTKGIIHRDIKPGNLFYKNDDGSDILVGDFGISSELDIEGGMSKRITSTSRTEGYAAPEIYSGVIGKEIDYYALGITIFELLTGVNAFAGRNDGHIMRDTMQGRVIDDLLSRQESKNFSNRVILLLKGLLTVRHDKRWGFQEVSKFLNGETISVFQETFKEIPSIKINDIEYNEFGEIAKALAKYPEPSRKMLYRGMISRWAENFDSTLALKIGDIAEENNTIGKQEFGLFQLIYLLDPTYPYKLEDGNEIRSFEELKDFIFKNNKYVFNDLTNSNSQLFAWLKQRNLNDFVKNIEKINKLNYKPKRYNAILQISFMSEGFITQLDRSLLLKSLNGFKSLKDSQKEILLDQAKDQESPFSIWLELNCDKKIYDTWFSGKIKQDLKHWNGLIHEELFFYENMYLTQDEKTKNMERELQIQKLEEASKQNHLRPIPFGNIILAILFHLFLVSEVYIFYINQFHLGVILFVIYLIGNAIYLSTRRNDFFWTLESAKVSFKEMNYREAVEFSKSSNQEIVSIFDLKYFYDSREKVTELKNQNLNKVISEGGIYWSSTPCGKDLYYGFNFRTAEIVHLHESRKAKVFLCS
jgi:serine/threonine protein kinase